jgi:hypothetical protein
MHERVISRTHPGAVGMLLTVVGAAVLTAVCAQISFGYPVPTTLQTFAVLGSAAFLGARGRPASCSTSAPARSACPSSPRATAASTG